MPQHRLTLAGLLIYCSVAAASHTRYVRSGDNNPALVAAGRRCRAPTKHWVAYRGLGYDAAGSYSVDASNARGCAALCASGGSAAFAWSPRFSFVRPNTNHSQGCYCCGGAAADAAGPALAYGWNVYEIMSEPTPAVPTEAPTASPTPAPTTAAPTSAPTPAPTASPTSSPTSSPTPSPTNAPTAAPTASPTARPTPAPTTASPTPAPSAAPTSAPTAAPTASPTSSPTSSPTASPTPSPTASPTPQPTTAAPTNAPTRAPTPTPTASPTASPTTASPIVASPTPALTEAPATEAPTATAAPATKAPTPEPTAPEPTATRATEAPTQNSGDNRDDGGAVAARKAHLAVWAGSASLLLGALLLAHRRRPRNAAHKDFGPWAKHPADGAKRALPAGHEREGSTRRFGRFLRERYGVALGGASVRRLLRGGAGAGYGIAPAPVLPTHAAHAAPAAPAAQRTEAQQALRLGSRPIAGLPTVHAARRQAWAAPANRVWSGSFAHASSVANTSEFGAPAATTVVYQV